MSNRKVIMRGIDTSYWQGSKVDYYRYRLSGGDFVFLRIGCDKTKDKSFENDYANAIASGLKVGVYFYTYATSVVDAIADATRVLGWLNDRHLDFPIAYDVENNRQKKLTKLLNSEMYNQFANRIEQGGVYDAILYTGEYFFNTYFQKSLITDDIWIAKYSGIEPNVNRLVQIWQYTSSEVYADYYSGKLDRNYMYTDHFVGSRKQTINVSLNPYAEPTRIIKYRLPMMKGNDVKWIQWQLGFKDSDIDGIYGKMTANAVYEWQKNHGLLCDKIVGSATIYSLKYD